MAIALIAFKGSDTGGNMPRITAIQAQERRRDRVNVFLDDEYAFSLQSILAVGLRHGQELTEEDIQALQKQDAVESAYEGALHFLSYRPRSEEEMRRYLRKRGAAVDAVSLVLARLQHAGLVDDGQFVQFWVENRAAHRPRGAAGLRAELRQKGVSNEAIAEALTGLDEEGNAMNAARQVAERLAPKGEQLFRRRLLGFLQRRGFGYEVSRRVTDHLWAEVAAQQEADPHKRATPDEI